MGELADIVGGGTPSTSNFEYWDGDIDWYAPAEIADQIFVSSSERKITQQGYDNSSAKMLPVGTVLFTSRAGIGKTAILRKEGCTNQGFQSIVPHINELDSYFIFSRSEEMKKYGETVGAGSTFVEVSGKQMANMELMMPTTMEEQVTIGSFFRNLDSIITLHQREYFSFDFDSQSAIIAQNTFSWEQRKCSDFIKLVGGATPSKANKDYWDGDIVWLSSQEIKGGFVSKGTYNITQKAVDDNTTKMIPANTPMFISRSGILANSFPITRALCNVAINQDIKALLFDHTVFSNDYIVHYLESKEQFILKSIVKSGTTVQSISIPDFEKMPINIPASKDEQDRIGIYFENLDTLITLHQHKPNKKGHDVLTVMPFKGNQRKPHYLCT